MIVNARGRQQRPRYCDLNKTLNTLNMIVRKSLRVDFVQFVYL